MKTNSVVSVPPPASHDEIATRARQIWQSRGCPYGQDVEIWLLAERELAVPLPSAAQPTPTIPIAKKGSKSNRKGVPAPSAEGGPELIDVGELQDRLKRFGESPQRSPTAVDLT